MSWNKSLRVKSETNILSLVYQQLPDDGKIEESQDCSKYNSWIIRSTSHFDGFPHFLLKSHLETFIAAIFVEFLYVECEESRPRQSTHGNLCFSQTRPFKRSIYRQWCWKTVIHGSKGWRTHVHLAIFYLCPRFKSIKIFSRISCKQKLPRARKLWDISFTVSEKYVEDTFEATLLAVIMWRISSEKKCENKNNFSQFPITPCIWANYHSDKTYGFLKELGRSPHTITAQVPDPSAEQRVGCDSTRDNPQWRPQIQRCFGQVAICFYSKKRMIQKLSEKWTG